MLCVPGFRRERPSSQGGLCPFDKAWRLEGRNKQINKTKNQSTSYSANENAQKHQKQEGAGEINETTSVGHGALLTLGSMARVPLLTVGGPCTRGHSSSCLV